MSKVFIFFNLLIGYHLIEIVAQDPEVVKTARQFCHSTEHFFYFKNDETLKSKADIELSRIFDYQEGTYFVSAGVKTILLLPSNTLEKSLDKAAGYFEKQGDYTFAVRGQSRTMMKDAKAVYRFYPYRNAIVFEMFK